MSLAPVYDYMPYLPIGFDAAGMDQLHSITIYMPDGNTPATKNTWKDWHLIPKTRPIVAPPEPQMELVEIPGSDDPLDYTQAMDGLIHYKQRTGSWEFYWLPAGQPPNDVMSDILKDLNIAGRTKIMLHDDDAWFYTGRVWLSNWESGDHVSTVTLNYNIDPYKKNMSSPTIREL